MTEKARRSIDYTLATLAVEGLRPSTEALHLCKRRANGELTLDEVVEAIKRKYGVADGQHS